MPYRISAFMAMLILGVHTYPMSVFPSVSKRILGDNVGDPEEWTVSWVRGSR